MLSERRRLRTAPGRRPRSLRGPPRCVAIAETAKPTARSTLEYVLYVLYVTVLVVPVLGSTLRRADAFARTELGRPPDTWPTLPQIMQMRQRLGFVGQQTVGWCDEVNLICVCGANEDAEHTPDCPLADDLLRE